MKISASIYSSSSKDLPSLVHELDALHLDYIHIDCFDDRIKKVEKDIKAIQQLSKIPIDLHAISANYQHYYQLAEQWKVKLLTLQFENLPEDFQTPNQKTYEFGLAITMETPIEALQKYANQLDYILLMTTIPGKSGGQFKSESFNRIRQLKQLYPGVPIVVDGGINAEVSFILRLLGVNLAVSGSFLVNHDHIAVALADLRFHHKGSAFLVKDFMIPKENLPILNVNDANFAQLLQAMEDYKMGVVFFENQQQFIGISSNADIRRGLLKNQAKIVEDIETYINHSPVVIQSDTSTYDMIEQVKKANFPILFLPVLKEKQLVGAINFNELIKGEA